MPRALVVGETDQITAIVIQIKSGAHYELALLAVPRITNVRVIIQTGDGGDGGDGSCAIARRSERIIAARRPISWPAGMKNSNESRAARSLAENHLATLPPPPPPVPPPPAKPGERVWRIFSNSDSGIPYPDNADELHRSIKLSSEVIDNNLSSAGEVMLDIRAWVKAAGAK
jgi:hypothetical protein